MKVINGQSIEKHLHVWYICAGISENCPEYEHDFCECGVDRPHIDGQSMEEEA